jgi:nitrogen fixation protein NifU and related proteins
MDDFYRDEILEHYRHPHNKGRLDSPDVTYEDHNPFCGDTIGIDLLVKDNQVVDAHFWGQGCAISQASASMLTDQIKGMTLDEVKALGKTDVLDLLGIPIGPVRMKCALLSLKVLKAGVWGIDKWPDED